MALIFVMIDGVGLAPAEAGNPVATEFVHLARALGSPLTNALHLRSARLLARPIDATLDVPGLPQSGSGHTSLYGGFNAAAANGRHQPSFPTVAMREQLAKHNLLLAALSLGARVAWANAYLPGYDEAVARRRLRHTAGTWCALQAGLPLRGLNELESGTAVAWDITQRLARTRPGASDLPEITPQAAGARLALLAQSHELVAFETYLPDLAGHGRLDITVEDALRLVDGLLAGIIVSMAQHDTLVVTSDHGNVEDRSTRIHTRNPVPLLAIGPAAQFFATVRSIDMVTPALLAALPGGYG